MAALVFLAVLPSHQQKPLWMQIVFNLAHMPAYGILFFLYIKWSSRITDQVLLAGFIATLLFGSYTEYLQSLTASRTASGIDIFLDGMGAAVLIFIIKKTNLVKMRTRQTKTSNLINKNIPLS